MEVAPAQAAASDGGLKVGRSHYGIRRLSTNNGSASARARGELIGFDRIIPATKPATWAE